MIYLLRYWKQLAILAVILAIFAAGYAVKAKDAREAAELSKAQASIAAQAGEIAALKEADRKQEAATQAADEARKRNDTEIPRIRADTKGRVDRAPTADPTVSLQDDNAALEAFAAADRALRGTKPR